MKCVLLLLVFLAKARRQVKAVKPKKMIRLEGKVIVSSACNCGSSALVSRDGEVFVFGKDAFHCDNSTGTVAVTLNNASDYLNNGLLLDYIGWTNWFRTIGFWTIWFRANGLWL